MEIVGKVIPEELFKKKGLNSREDIDATLLAIEGLEFCIIARLIPFLFHHAVPA